MNRKIMRVQVADAAKKAISAAQKGREVPIDRTIKALKTKFRKYGYLSTPIKRGSWRAAWHDIGGKRKFYRSKWEANYARYLEWQKAHGIISDWSHESEVFWFEGIKRGCVSYLPDFRVITTAGVVEFHEVKGWMDARSKTKIRRMAKYHPDVVLKVFDAAWCRSNAPKLKRLVPGWQ